jgi:hypothetical protein
VGDPFRPIFLKTWPTLTPGASDGTRNELMPEGLSSPVRANTT